MYLDVALSQWLMHDLVKPRDPRLKITCWVVLHQGGSQRTTCFLNKFCWFVQASVKMKTLSMAFTYHSQGESVLTKVHLNCQRNT